MIDRFDELAGRVRSGPARLGTVRLVAVDGPAGSGKSTFAGRLTGALRAGGADVAEVHTDDLLDGWDDTVTFWPRLEAWVLGPLRRGEPGAYRAYDWSTASFAPAWRAVRVPEILVLEGVSSARAEARAELTLGVFVTAPRALRLARGLARDGAELAGHWARWATREDAHFALDCTVDHVELRVDGAPTVPHDPEIEYVPTGCG